MEVPVAAAGRPVGPAEVVPERVGRREPAREMAGELAVERTDDVVRPQREPGRGGDRLLIEPV